MSNSTSHSSLTLSPKRRGPRTSAAKLSLLLGVGLSVLPLQGCDFASVASILQVVGQVLPAVQGIVGAVQGLGQGQGAGLNTATNVPAANPIQTQVVPAGKNPNLAPANPSAAPQAPGTPTQTTVGAPAIADGQDALNRQLEQNPAPVEGALGSDTISAGREPPSLEPAMQMG